jgi:hypothetical protein
MARPAWGVPTSQNRLSRPQTTATRSRASPCPSPTRAPSYSLRSRAIEPFFVLHDDVVQSCIPDTRDPRHTTGLHDQVLGTEESCDTNDSAAEFIDG